MVACAYADTDIYLVAVSGAAFQQAEVKRWKDVIKQANIQLE